MWPLLGLSKKKTLQTFITLLVLCLVEKIFWSDKTYEKDFLRPLWNVSIKCKYQVKVSNVSIKCKYQLRASEAGKRVFLANKLIFFSAFELKVSSAGDSLWYFCRHIYFKLNFSSPVQWTPRFTDYKRNYPQPVRNFQTS